MKTTILIIAKNEAGGIQKIIRSVKKYANEIIVVDGHSTDDTFRLAKKEGIKTIRDHGFGRGDGVRVGFAAAKGDIVVLFDADGSHNPKDIPTLISPIAKKKADLVIASRRTGGTLDTNTGFDGVVRSFGADLLAYLVNKRFGTHFTDVIFSFRALRRSAVPLLRLQSNGFAIEQEMVVSALDKNIKIIETPSRELARKWGASKLTTAGGFKLLISLLIQLVRTGKYL